MRGITAFTCMSDLRDHLIEESLALFDTPKAAFRKKQAFSRFMNSGWAAAIICLFVGAGVLFGVLWAGRQSPGPTPAVSGEGQDSHEDQQEESEALLLPDETEDEGTTDVSAEEVSTDAEPETEAATEAESDAETETQAPIVVDGSLGLGYQSNGDGTCVVSGLNHCTDTHVVIPTVSPAGDRVIGIGGGAFRETDIEEVVIHGGVAEIGRMAFYDCDQLSAVSLSPGVVEISEFAFWGCDALREIILPDTVTTLGQMVFAYSKSLERVNIPSGVHTVRYQMFVDCVKLSEVTLSEGLVKIDDLAFSGCRSLVSLDIPESVDTFGAAVFMKCTSLKDIRLPSEMRSWGESVFTICTSLERIEIPQGLKRVSRYAFQACDNLTEVVIPEGVTLLGEFALDLCPRLTTVKLPESLQTVEEFAFLDCPELTELSYAGTVEEWAKVKVIISDWKTDALNHLTVVCSNGVVLPSGIIPDETTDTWDGSIATAFAGGQGTKENPYIIKTGAQLAYLAKQVNAGQSYNNKSFLLENDIDLNGISWTPIGTYTKFLQGNFDGGGHRISGLSVRTAVVSDDVACAGLFGFAADCTIRNLELVSPVVEINLENKASYAYIGALCGGYQCPNVEKESYIENCRVTDGKITVQKGNTAHVGGMIGYVISHDGCDILLENLESHATMKVTDTTKAHTGGLAGYLYAYKSGRIEVKNFCGYTTASTIRNGTQYVGTIGAIAAPDGRMTLRSGYGSVTVNGELLTSNSYKNDGYAIVGLIYDGATPKRYYFYDLFGRLTAQNKNMTDLYFCYEPVESGVDHLSAYPKEGVLDEQVWDLSDPKKPTLKFSW
ncbi:MAG: hypothetical protein E7661_09435 [Ruminococcaceae bacterium]|nr:hypothetical protein [Oscillospiraceae bacterium]